jgi:hypothetical protein
MEHTNTMVLLRLIVTDPSTETLGGSNPNSLWHAALADAKGLAPAVHLPPIGSSLPFASRTSIKLGGMQEESTKRIQTGSPSDLHLSLAGLARLARLDIDGRADCANLGMFAVVGFDRLDQSWRFLVDCGD